ncbi:MAG: bifunctional (p)ppGpp synthetase/guanosine-3',5'-bis(diphosphate) 3'-pyrophosphohydrolase [Leptotrichiaceae bacterium]|nr:bifunctional (p)ppGpp synthetase/guanosine-3',5'-bis(diphosphate) 3'-pyrophosphohydrolase [Leptotrichiaceae bacterium]MBP6167430.1 bifunctional (p)ppGpp synthetase/guanosine-3',5'-bis(diphosphate) 3'-pyrophosphohydrolase [Leptotrichiaceae bacterium]MBP8636788.1 bifunctional (p)ppGpp synthetase/guanosine-3',5'-bis(diphosphate) 3'-pyrophosphohydrolase [Leptotrichiaceae bacterium]MBP9875836.1 bifunctional (p)ppGpp synthetase/guanosine-3',5'-bis(diphosphate) 3'-pyrophosphohydrolase [Leptotrichiac
MDEEKDLFQRLVNRIKENKLDVDINKIQQAYILANESHIGQKRKSGEDYILHLIEVAEILADMKMDTDTIVAGILHDVVEDTLITLSDIEYTFGSDVTKLVDGVTKLRNLPRTDSKKIENIRKMIVAMSEDIRVVIIKLADRLHNMRTLTYMKPEKQIEKSKESLEIFAPIAHRIGMARIKWELEDISFRYLYPEDYNEISDLVNAKREEREEYTTEIITAIQKEMAEQGIEAEVTGRPKHLYSIYKKIHEKEKKFADLYDLIAIRILVKKEVECYNVLGIIHSIFIPVSGRFKDYIAVPKPNGYQSIHTTIVGPNHQNVEVQIRTYEMHAIAEDGVAAHWKYKEKKSKTKNDEYYAAVKKMVEKSTNDGKDVKESKDNTHNFAKKVTGNVLSQTIFVFTPKGDVIELPNNSTALDFAFHIHTQIGYKTIGSKVNDKIVQLDHVLKNGDKVEVLTSKNLKGPGKDWINMVNNHSARVKIKKWFKDEEYVEKVHEGEQILEKEFEKLNIKLKDLEDDERVFLYMKKFNVLNFQSMCYKFAVGDLSLEGFLKRFEVKEVKNLEQVLEEETEKGNRRKEKSTGGIQITGTENTMYHFAKCCSPLPGDQIRGFVTRGRGIVIHRADCPNFKTLLEKEAEREIEVFWDDKELELNTTKYEFYFTIKVADRTGVLLDIVRILNEYKMEIVNVNTNMTKENGISYALIRMGIMIKRKEDFDRLANNLLSMPDVVEIIRK